MGKKKKKKENSLLYSQHTLELHLDRYVYKLATLLAWLELKHKQMPSSIW